MVLDTLHKATGHLKEIKREKVKVCMKTISSSVSLPPMLFAIGMNELYHVVQP